MDEAFKIYVERLRDGHREKLVETLSPEFFEIHEAELVFKAPVYLTGEAYLAEESLILHLDIKTEAMMPCSICNEPVLIEIHIANFYHAQPMEETKSGVYDFKALLRETILLEIPKTVECKGNCPERKEMVKYFSKNSKQKQDEEYHPFADL